MKISLLTKLTLLIFGLNLVACDIFFNEEEAMGKAREFYKNDKSIEAIFQLKKVLDKNPTNREARVFLGKSYLQIEQGASAEKELKYAVEIGEPEYRVIAELSEAYLLQGKFKDAISIADVKSVKDKSIRSKLIISQGFASLGLRRYADAENYFVKAIDMGIHLADANVGLASCYIVQNKSDRSLDVLDKALEVDKNHAKALLLKSHVLISKGKNTQAEKLLRKIINTNKLINSTTFKARVFLIQLAFNEKNLDRAKKESSDFVQALPNHPTALYFSALVSFQQERYDDAETTLKKVLVLTPNDLKSRLLFGAVNYAKKNYEQANKHLSYFVDNVPTHIPAQKLLAIVKIKLGRQDEVYGTLSAALNADKTDSQLLAIIGKAALTGNRPDEAISYLKRAQISSPASAELKTELARAYMSKGDYDNAIAELDKIKGNSSLQARSLRIMAKLKKKDVKSAKLESKQLIKDFSKSPYAYFVAAEVAFMTRDYTESEQLNSRAIEISPKFVPSLLALAKIMIEKGDRVNAKQLYNKVTTIEPENENAVIGLALIAEQDGELENSVSLIQNYLERRPAAFVPRVIISRYYLRNGKLSKAKEHSSILVEHHKNNKTANLVYAQILNAANDFRKSLAISEYMITKWPEYADGYVESARSNIGLKRFNKAEQILLTAIKKQPDHVSSNVTLVSTYVANKKVNKALALISTIKQKENGKLVGSIMAGDVYVTQKSYKLAKREYTAAFKHTPTTKTLIKLVKTYEILGEFSEAEKYYSKWINENPEDFRVRMSLANMYSGQKRNNKAIEQYKYVILVNPENVAALNNLALMLINNNINESMDYAKKAYNLNKQHPAIIDTYGWVLLNSGNTKQALSILQESASKSKNPSIQYHYAVALIKNGNTSKAKKILQSIEGKKFDEAVEVTKLLKSI